MELFFLKIAEGNLFGQRIGDNDWPIEAKAEDSPLASTDNAVVAELAEWSIAAAC